MTTEKKNTDPTKQNGGRSASINVANNIVNGYYVSTAMWATYIPATEMRHPTYETFIWEWDEEKRKRGELIKQIYHSGFRKTAINFHFRFCRTLAWRQLKHKIKKDSPYIEMEYCC